MSKMKNRIFYVPKFTFYNWCFVYRPFPFNKFFAQKKSLNLIRKIPITAVVKCFSINKIPSYRTFLIIILNNFLDFFFKFLSYPLIGIKIQYPGGCCMQNSKVSLI